MLRKLADLKDHFLCHTIAHPDGIGHFAFFAPNEEAYQEWPAYPMTARPEAGRAGAGCGLTEGACWTSGLGEAVERASCCAWDDERLVQSTIRAAGETALIPDSLLGFSTRQLTQRQAWNDNWRGIDWCPPAAAPDAMLDWCEAHHAITGASVLVPADFVLLGRRRRGDPDAVAVAESTGCAAGPTPEAARLWALLELLERDAIGRWWYGARSRPCITLAEMDINPGLKSCLNDRARQTVLFDISTDLWQPVVAAVSWRADGSHIALGFSARHTLNDAVERAVVEMLQIEIGIDQRLALGERGIQDWCAQVRPDTPPLAPKRVQTKSPQEFEYSANAGLDLDALVRRLQTNGIDVWFIDRTRAEFGLPVVRAVAPGLCSDKPRWGCHRLTATDAFDLHDIAPGLGHEPPNPRPLWI